MGKTNDICNHFCFFFFQTTQCHVLGLRLLLKKLAFEFESYSHSVPTKENEFKKCKIYSFARVTTVGSITGKKNLYETYILHSFADFLLLYVLKLPLLVTFN